MAADNDRCAVCGRAFDGTPEEMAADEKLAVAEAKELFGVDDPLHHPQMVRICDDCFRTLTPEEHRKMGREFQERSRAN